MPKETPVTLSKREELAAELSPAEQTYREVRRYHVRAWVYANPDKAERSRQNSFARYLRRRGWTVTGSPNTDRSTWQSVGGKRND